VILAGFTAAAAGQSPHTAATGGEGARSQIYAGWQGVITDYWADKSIQQNGFKLEYDQHLWRFVDGVVSFRRTTGNPTMFVPGRIWPADIKMWTLAAGARVVPFRGKYQPFAEVLVGYTHHFSEGLYRSTPVTAPTPTTITGSSTILGGGFDIILTRRFAIRLGEAEYQLVPMGHLGHGSTFGNLGAGVIYRF
jgi:hypothetical protein